MSADSIWEQRHAVRAPIETDRNRPVFWSWPHMAYLHTDDGSQAEITSNNHGDGSSVALRTERMEISFGAPIYPNFDLGDPSG